MAYWSPLRGVSDPIPIREFNGVYKPDDEGFNLPETLATDIANLSLDAYPALTTRPDFTLLGTAFGGRIRGLATWKDTEIHAIGNGVWSKWNGSSWTQLATGLNTNADFSFVNFKGNLGAINLIAANGVDSIKRYDGSTVQNLANAPAGGNYITSHANRLYCAVGNTLKFSALNKADDWTTNKDAGEIEIDTPNGETINALAPSLEFLTIFKPSSIHQLYGTGPSTYKREDIAFDIGIVNNRSHVMVQGILYFMDSQGIYRFTGGVRPSKTFSKPVQRYMDGINLGQLSKCCAGTDGKKALFGIPYGSSTEVNVILVYDPMWDRWTVWEGIAATCFTLSQDVFYYGDTSGNVKKQGGNQSGITGRWVSKPFVGRSAANKMSFYDAWIRANIPSGSTLKVYLSASSSGDSDWELVKTVTEPTSKIVIPAGKAKHADVVRIKMETVGPVTIYEIARRERELPWR